MTYGLSENNINKLAGVFKNYPLIEEVILYGSRAKGNFRDGSDIDLTLKGERLTEEICSKIWLDLDELELVYLIDLSLFKSLSSDSLRQHIERNGKIFYKKTNSLTESEMNE